MTDDTTGSISGTEPLALADDDGTVTLRKRVSRGERLEIASRNDSVTLDALLLEGLAWQRDRAAVDALLGDGTALASDPVGASEPPAASERPADGTADADDAANEPAADPISISNEYSHVQVRPVRTAAGAGIVVTTPGRGTSITLGVQSLRELATVEDTYVFSVWFETPFGPEDTPVEGPL